MDLQVWLKKNALEKYAPVLKQRGCTSLDTLANYRESDLKAMGLSTVGARRKFATAIEKFNTARVRMAEQTAGAPAGLHS